MSAMYLELGDWENFRSIFAPDAVIHDERPNSTNAIIGQDAILRNFRDVAERGVTRVSVELIAAREDGLAFARMEMCAKDGSVIASFYDVSQADGTLIVSGWLYDSLDIARARFDHLDHEIYGTPIALEAEDVAEGAPFSEIGRAHV